MFSKRAPEGSTTLSLVRVSKFRSWQWALGLLFIAAHGSSAQPVALVAGYNQNGERDYFFGTGGVVAYDASHEGGDGIRRLALDANGNIVALGWASAIGTSAGNMLLLRLLGSCPSR